MTKEANLEAVNSALSKEVRKLQEELKQADKRCATVTVALLHVMEAGVYQYNCGCTTCVGARLAVGEDA